MDLYIEEFLIESSVIYFCLLRLIKISTKTNTTNFKLILASLIGAGINSIALMNANNLLVYNLIKVIIGITIIKIAFKTNFKQFFVDLILLMLFSYSFTGLIYSISTNKQFMSNNLIILNNLNPTMIAIILITLTYIYELVLKSIKFNFQKNSLIYELELFKDNKSIKINAYLDTGNLLSIDGKGIIVLDLDTFCKLTNKTKIDIILDKNLITTQTVTSNNTMSVFEIDKITLEGKEITSNYIAVDTNSVFKDKNYKALLSPLNLN